MSQILLSWLFLGLQNNGSSDLSVVKAVKAKITGLTYSKSLNLYACLCRVLILLLIPSSGPVEIGLSKEAKRFSFSVFAMVLSCLFPVFIAVHTRSQGIGELLPC